ncbi:MAG: hypothetical protein QXF26_06385 [Candidatus Bathyarchaeia archaeon]
MEGADEYKRKYELVKKRLIASLNRLRGLGFFEGHKNLTSEELFERIRRGELGGEWSGPWESIEEASKNTGYWVVVPRPEEIVKRNREALDWFTELTDLEIDYLMMEYDMKKVIKRGAEVKPEYRGKGLEFFGELLRISRGFFNPDEAKEEKWWESILKEDEHGYECLHTYIPIRIKFKGREHLIKILFKDEYMYPIAAVGQINELIKDTGYQYYTDYHYEGILFIMLTEEEARKLTDEFLGKVGRKLKVVRAEPPPVQRSLEVNDAIREHLIESIEYLRNLGFFEEHKNLTSEELFERIRRGEIGREWLNWWGPKELPSEKRRKKQRAYYDESFAYDRYIACHDKRRVFFESMMRYCPEDAGVELLEKLAWISRGAFNPTEIREGRIRHTKDYWTLPIYFKFGGKELRIKLIRSAVLNLDLIASQINELIKDTGYQYYTFDRDFYENISILMLTEGEATRLVKDRSWKLWVFRKDYKPSAKKTF